MTGPGERIAGFSEKISEDSNVSDADADTQEPAQAEDVLTRLQEGVSDSSHGVLELKDWTDKTIMQLLDEFGLEPEVSGDENSTLSVAHDGESES